jgi:hypothetical protein
MEAGATTGRIVLDSLDSLGPMITTHGYDIKQPGKADGLSDARAQEVFGTYGMDLIRIPIYANAHTAPGTVENALCPSPSACASYDKIVAAVWRAKAAKSTVKVFASLKSGEYWMPPAWVMSGTTVDANKWAYLLADFIHYMAMRGVTVDHLGIDNENFIGTAESASRHHNIVVEVKRLLNNLGHLPPKIVASEGWEPKPGFFTSAMLSAKPGSASPHPYWSDLDYAGFHYYSDQRTSTYVSNLDNFMTNASPRYVWQTEFHWTNLPGDEYADASAGLIAAFDNFDNKTRGMTWWEFKPRSLGTLTSMMQTALVQSTIDSQNLLNVDDQDGPPLGAGKMNTRAFKQGTSIRIWINNDTSTSYTGKWVEIRGMKAGKSISSINPPALTRWNATAETVGTAKYVNTTTFSLDVPAKSVVLITVPNMY